MGEKLSFPHLFLPTVSDVADRPSVSTLPPLAPLARRVRGVLFDMCNIFYDDTEWRRWLLRLLTQLGLQTNYHSFFHVWDRDYLDQVCQGRTSFREAFQSFLFSAGMSRGQIEEVQAACRTHRRMIDVSLRPLPGVTSTVARLVESGLVLGAICNSEHPAQGLRDRLQRFSMVRWFSAVVSSVDLGRTMPDPECYRTATRHMKLPAEEVAFVGHDTAELAGAANLGMATIAFNFDADARADVYVGGLGELPTVLASSSTSLVAVG